MVSTESMTVGSTGVLTIGVLGTMVGLLTEGLVAGGFVVVGT